MLRKLNWNSKATKRDKILNIESSKCLNLNIILINWYKGRSVCTAKSKDSGSKTWKLKESSGFFPTEELPEVFCECSWEHLHLGPETELAVLGGTHSRCSQSPSKQVLQSPPAATPGPGQGHYLSDPQRNAPFWKVQDVPVRGFPLPVLIPSWLCTSFSQVSDYQLYFFPCGSSAVWFEFVLWRNFSEGKDNFSFSS